MHVIRFSYTNSVSGSFFRCELVAKVIYYYLFPVSSYRKYTFYPRKGVNIVRMSDGTVKKVVVK